MKKREIQLVPQTHGQVMCLLGQPAAIKWRSAFGLREHEDQQIMDRIVELFNFSFPADHRPHGRPRLDNVYRDNDKVVMVVTWRYDYMGYSDHEEQEGGYDTVELSDEELESAKTFWDAAARHLAWKNRQDLALTAVVPNNPDSTAGYLALLEAAGLDEETIQRRRNEVIAIALDTKATFLAEWSKTNPEPPTV